MLTSANLQSKKQKLLSRLYQSKDMIVRDFLIAESLPACVIYLETLTDATLINRDVLSELFALKKIQQHNVLEHLVENVISNAQAKIIDKDKDALLNILTGSVVLLVDGQARAISIPVQQWAMRAVQEPPTEIVVQGPREGFVEDMKTNITLVRRRLPTPDLVMEERVVGKYTQTKITICYLSSVADRGVVRQIKERLSKMEIDGVLDSYYVLEYLEPNHNYIFKQVGSNERPDAVVSKILEGRVALIVDGSPVVLTVPHLLIEDIQTPDGTD